jgi:predicted DCC family thiol-disulfide oxidoreductase YuxK
MKGFPMKNKSIVLFDGVCKLCNGSVQFISKRDSKDRFRFANLQADVAKELLAHHNIVNQEMNSVILIEQEEVYTKSTAALKIARHLSGLWPLCYGLIVIPPIIRNAVYRFIANNRYQWFGKKESCMVPGKELKHKFLSTS